MALTKCPDCGKEVSQDAWACPGCGKPFRSPLGLLTAKNAKRLFGLWLALIVVFLIVWQVLNQPHR